MALKFSCSECGEDIVVMYLKVNEEVKCRGCGALVKVPETAIAVNEPSTTVKIPCPSCTYFDISTGACLTIKENVRDHPNRFIKKCHGKFYLRNDKIIEKDSSEETMGIIDETISSIPSDGEGVGRIGYAGFWKRVAATLIDGILLYIVNFIVIFLFTLPFAVSGMQNQSQLQARGIILGVIIWWLYFAVMESRPTQATLGKMALGIKVTDLKGNRVDFARASGRVFGKLVSTLILFMGFIMAGFTEKKQALHDMMARCLVVNK